MKTSDELTLADALKYATQDRAETAPWRIVYTPSPYDEYPVIPELHDLVSSRSAVPIVANDERGGTESK